MWRSVTVSSCLLLCVACSRTTLSGSVVDEHGDRDEFAEMDFWDGLAAVDAISNHDALHALVLSYTDGPATDYAARVAVARRRGWIDEGDELVANETARVGWIARAVCIEAGVKGGLTMRVVGPAERYAVNELNHRKWLPQMSPRQSLSGGQLIALLSRAEDHVSGAGKEPKEDL